MFPRFGQEVEDTLLFLNKSTNHLYLKIYNNNNFKALKINLSEWTDQEILL